MLYSALYILTFTSWQMNRDPAPVTPPSRSTSVKIKFSWLNLFSLMYPQTQKKNEIKVSLKNDIAFTFLSVRWVAPILFSSTTAAVPTFANVTTSTWRMVHNFFGNITHDPSVSIYVAQFDLSLQWWWYLLHTFIEVCSSSIQKPSWLILTNDSYLAELVRDS